jgi:hypothetical protein
MKRAAGAKSVQPSGRASPRASFRRILALAENSRRRGRYKAPSPRLPPPVNAGCARIDTLGDMPGFRWWFIEMRLCMFLIVVGVGAVIYGGYEGRLAWRERAPLEMSCADYVKQRPSARWVRVTGCDILGVVYTYQGGGVAASNGRPGSTVGVYFLARPPGETGPVPLVVNGVDQAVRNIIALAEPKRTDQLRPIIQAMAMAIEGMTDAVDPAAIKYMAENDKPPAPDIRAIEQGAHPLVGFAIASRRGRVAVRGNVPPLAHMAPRAP